MRPGRKRLVKSQTVLAWVAKNREKVARYWVMRDPEGTLLHCVTLAPGWWFETGQAHIHFDTRSALLAALGEIGTEQ